MAPRIFRSIEEARGQFGPSVLTIGNFDGVHLGHQSIFREVIRVAGEYGWKPSVMTFDPHPLRVVAPEKAPRMLSSVAQRCRWMGELGISQVMILPFTPQIALLPAEDFVRAIVAGALGAKAVLVGDNFRFGHKQGGTTATLRELGEELGFEAWALHSFRLSDQTVSSTEVRKHVLSGRVSRAGRMLGRFYSVEGEVVTGHGIGAKQTVPTLNLKTDAEVLPASGVYVSRTQEAGTQRSWTSVTNIGHRPTFLGRDLAIETFLLDPLEGDSPHAIRVELTHRLREERLFESAEHLRQQIFKDAGRARAWHRRFLIWRRGGHAAHQSAKPDITKH